MSDDDFDDLLPDDLRESREKAKGKAAPLKRTRKQAEKSAKAREEKKARDDLAIQATRAKAEDAQLAQIVNLVIAGNSLAAIGADIGMSEAEVDNLLQKQAQRYVRNQPALRTYVRNFISGEYAKLLKVNDSIARDVNHAEHLEHQDRNLKILKEMGRLHGAEAPIQSEVRVESSVESVDSMVERLSRANGYGYDPSVFDSGDIVDAEVVDDIVEGSLTALEAASTAVEEEGDDDDF